MIIEDGTYAFLDASPPPPLQALAPERTFYVASLSKNVATGWRFGFAVIPPGHARAVTSSMRAVAWGTPGLITALAVGWLADGTVTQLDKARREDAAARQEIAGTALAGLDITAHPTSYIVWLGLQPHQRPDHAAAALAAQGILVSTGDAFATGPYRPHALRLALATPPLGELGPAAPSAGRDRGDPAVRMVSDRPGLNPPCIVLDTPGIVPRRYEPCTTQRRRLTWKQAETMTREDGFDGRNAPRC